MAVQERYKFPVFLCAPCDSLQGVALRPLPCNYNVLEFVGTFHGGNTGSNPVGDAKLFQRLAGNSRSFRRHKKAQLWPSSGEADCAITSVLAGFDLTFIGTKGHTCNSL